MTYEEIKKNEEVLAYLKKGNDVLGVMGYTDHSAIHCCLYSEKFRIFRKRSRACQNCRFYA